MRKHLLALLITLLISASTAWAGDVEDANAALDKKDYATALMKYKSAAAKNDAYAQLQVGNFYTEGLGVKQDYAEAVLWYKLSAAQGDSIAQYNLANLYQEGLGVLQDYAEAVRWYKLAAEQGNISSQVNLGVMYGKGQGVLQDNVRTHMWFNIAATKGNKVAVRNRDFIAAKMTPQQIAEAQKLARECMQRNFKACD